MPRSARLRWRISRSPPPPGTPARRTRPSDASTNEQTLPASRRACIRETSAQGRWSRRQGGTWKPTSPDARTSSPAARLLRSWRTTCFRSICRPGAASTRPSSAWRPRRRRRCRSTPRQRHREDPIPAGRTAGEPPSNTRRDPCSSVPPRMGCARRSGRGEEDGGRPLRASARTARPYRRPRRACVYGWAPRRCCHPSHRFRRAGLPRVRMKTGHGTASRRPLFGRERRGGLVRKRPGGWWGDTAGVMTKGWIMAKATAARCCHRSGASCLPSPSCRRQRLHHRHSLQAVLNNSASWRPALRRPAPPQ
mmetsp:Transcript_56235/g.168371  ORF Transcript_56235/g.168371 Transcript_56235/m.168371 type:complete len:308 (-) Transcript_56235:659-1582(-)